VLGCCYFVIFFDSYRSTKGVFMSFPQGCGKTVEKVLC
jgi:hypothetical protein